ncbi:MAG: CBS domain-containing protein [Rhodobacteraceae bacterium]|nr:CBS domain-containing protein [Paracoccaceae bacterium]
MTVAKILRSKGNDDVVTIQPGKKVSEAAIMLSEKRIGTVVVSEDGSHAMGILSERDIVREIGRRGGSCLDDAVEEMMTSKLVTCDRSERVDDVLQKMTEGRFRHMPVVVDGNLVGLITLGDVVKFRLNELAMEKDALEGMIMGH